MRTIPVDVHGEMPTCLCGLGADGLGSCTLAPIARNDGWPIIVSWSDARAGSHQVCTDCGLLIETPRVMAPATVADAMLWTEAARNVVFNRGDMLSLCAVPVVGRLVGWDVFGNDDAMENARGRFVPAYTGRY